MFRCALSVSVTVYWSRDIFRSRVNLGHNANLAHALSGSASLIDRSRFVDNSKNLRLWSGRGVWVGREWKEGGREGQERWSGEGGSGAANVPAEEFNFPLPPPLPRYPLSVASFIPCHYAFSHPVYFLSVLLRVSLPPHSSPSFCHTLRTPRPSLLPPPYHPKRPFQPPPHALLLLDTVP